MKLLRKNFFMIRKSVVFLDRDGVINKKMPEGEYVKNWDQFHFLPGTLKALKILKRSDFFIVIVTNQSCVSNGIISEENLKKMHCKMLTEIKKYGGNVDAIYFCPHTISDNCNCRKPNPGMILKAINDLKKQGMQIDFQNSYMIGDSEVDILAGKSVGLMTISVRKYSKSSDFNKKNLLEAVEYILKKNTI